LRTFLQGSSNPHRILTATVAPLPSNSHGSAHAFDVGYEGGSDTEDSGDREYKYEPEYASTRSESVQEEYVFESEAVFVDNLKTPD